jgi:hypothetical protein
LSQSLMAVFLQARYPGRRNVLLVILLTL